MEEKKDIPLGLLVFSFGWLPAASAAYNPPKDNPSKPSFIPTAPANALSFHFILNFSSHSQREEKWNERKELSGGNKVDSIQKHSNWFFHFIHTINFSRFFHFINFINTVIILFYSIPFNFIQPNEIKWIK